MSSLDNPMYAKSSMENVAITQFNRVLIFWGALKVLGQTRKLSSFRIRFLNKIKDITQLYLERMVLQCSATDFAA